MLPKAPTAASGVRKLGMAASLRIWRASPTLASPIQQVNSAQPVINSFVFDRSGTTAYLGSDRSLLVLAAATNTITAPSTQLSGKVLAIAPDGGEVIYADQSAAPKTYVYNTASGTFTQLSLTTATTAAAFSPDSLKAFLVSGGNLWIYSSTLAPPLIRQPLTQVTGANDVTFLTQGSLGYLAGGAANQVRVYATCDNSFASSVAVPATPLKIDSSYDSTHVFAVDGTSIDDITVSNISTAAGTNCPATVTNSAATFNFGQGAFTPDQLIVTANGANVFVTTPSTKLLRYVVSGNATSAITMTTGTSITTGGATLDSQNLYLGMTGTNDVHRVAKLSPNFSQTALTAMAAAAALPSSRRRTSRRTGCLRALEPSISATGEAPFIMPVVAPSTIR